ncbi:MAG: secretion system protein [Actinobacteria bacterium]|nr:MAG: secretion system protein [Actinomycetota bacterium]
MFIEERAGCLPGRSRRRGPRPGLRWLLAPPTRPRPPRDRVRLVAGLAGVAAALLVGGVPGVIIGAACALLTPPLLRRLEPAAARQRRLQEALDLPLAADLLAAALRAGAPVAAATSAVADALGGSLGGRLATVARLLQLGAEPTEAWTHLSEVPGGERWAQAAVRSSASGAGLADALTRLADDLRADRAIAIEAAARRSGVLIVLPLGLCFLPAFILAGLVPVIIAVLGDLV